MANAILTHPQSKKVVDEKVNKLKESVKATTDTLSTNISTVQSNLDTTNTNVSNNTSSISDINSKISNLITKEGLEEALSGILPTLRYKANNMVVVTATCGEKIITGLGKGMDTWCTMLLPFKGEWTVSSTDSSGSSKSYTVDVIDCGNYEVNFLATIYGIQREVNSSSSAWTRTDDSANFTFSASLGNTAGSSDFDGQPIYKEIERVTLSTGDVMVKIPKFYFQRYRTDGVEHIRIADNEVEGFKLHPAFEHNGTTQDYIYIGAYKTSSNNKSVSGASCTVNQTRATMRANAKAKGTGWSLIDITAKSAVDMLILIEVADWNVQSKIGSGNCSTSGSIGTGKCDGVPNLTGRPSGTDTAVGVVWRGIENWWADLWEWVDGCNWKDGIYYICNNQDNYADDTANNYTALSYTGKTSWSGSYITELGMDDNNPAIMMPTEAGSGSSSTFMTDGCWGSTGWRVFLRSGPYARGLLCGLATAYLLSASSGAGADSSSRLLKV